MLTIIVLWLLANVGSFLAWAHNHASLGRRLRVTRHNKDVGPVLHYVTIIFLAIFFWPLVIYAWWRGDLIID